MAFGGKKAPENDPAAAPDGEHADQDMPRMDGTGPDGAGREPGSPSAARDAVAADEAGTEAQEWKDRFLRAKAELLNYQRRMEKERAEAIKYANAGLARALLSILDDLERVVASDARPAGDMEAILNGVRLTLENFRKILREYHVQPIDATGKPFDPAVHEAMMQQPTTDHPPGTVIQEVGKGYRLHDRVLRPSQVIVARDAAPQDRGGDEAEDTNS